MQAMITDIEDKRKYMSLDLKNDDDIDTMEDVYKKVATVTADRIAEAAEEVFSDMSTLIYK